MNVLNPTPACRYIGNGFAQLLDVILELRTQVRGKFDCTEDAP
jgi:hypothetical protein